MEDMNLCRRPEAVWGDSPPEDPYTVSSYADLDGCKITELVLSS